MKIPFFYYYSRILLTQHAWNQTDSWLLEGTYNDLSSYRLFFVSSPAFELHN
jgi:hypothetical protein